MHTFTETKVSRKSILMKCRPLLLLLLCSGCFSYVFGCHSTQSLPPDQPNFPQVVPASADASRDLYTEDNQSKASYVPLPPDARSLVITFTVNEENKIHILEVRGGYAQLNQYLRNSLEGKELKSDSAIPGMNYVMTVKLPATV